MGYSFAYEFEDAFGLGILPMLLSGIPSLAMNIVVYVLTAMTFYTIAKRRGLSNPWMAWVPVASAWLLGSISDQYRYVVKGEYKSKRKVLLTLSILAAVASLVVLILAVVTAGGAISGAMQNMPEEALVTKVIGPAMGILGISVPLAGIGIAYAIIRYMALYDVYTSMDPGNSVLFLVLSIVFNVTEPFFLFFNRHKDSGMPPRKRQYQEPAYRQQTYDQYVYEQPGEEPREPWNQDEPKTFL